MMRNASCGWFVVCALATTLSCQTPSQDWNGTWKLNPSKSNLQTTFTISISADGEYRYYHHTTSFTFRCDGKEWPIENNRTQACVQKSATVLDLIRKENGVETNTYHFELSAGGKVLTATATALRPSGPVITIRTASRMSGSNGFAGEWRDTSYLQRRAEMTLRLDGQTLHIGYPSGGEYIDAPFDGADAAVYGPQAPEGVTYAVRLVGQREIRILMKLNGKAYAQGSLELSDDGRVVTESWRDSNQPTGKATRVYERK